jgi:predicted naringenin-chalcone synthase
VTHTSPPAGSAYLNRVAGIHPQHEVHGLFVEWASAQIADDRSRALFARMAERSGIIRRWSVLGGQAYRRPDGLAFYGPDAARSTGERMAVYARKAPGLALSAIGKLGPLGPVTHLVVASCTGFVAPGIDQIVARALDLPGSLERVLIGYMGCYAGITALRTARHFVRSQPEARVLVVTVELCTLHLQAVDDIEKLLAMLQFGDGAAAALVSAEPQGLELTEPFSMALPESHDLITWTIGDHGFAMHLSGEVPGRIADALADGQVRRTVAGAALPDSWAVHAGGRSILDAVARGLALDSEALDHSRAVLAQCGNMSSATVLFVLERIMASGARIGNGRALAFGPGLAVEGLGYRSAP